MGDANRVALSYEKESAYNVAPASALEDVRYTGETLVHETNSVSSAEIRSDRQIPDVTRVGVGASGDTSHELSYAEFDDWLESALLSATWSSASADIAGAETTSVAAGTGVYTIDSGAWTVTPAVGDILEIRGSANALNNGYKVVTAATSTTITVSEIGTGATSTENLTIDILSDITNGVTFASYTLEKAFEDLSSIFARMGGGVINGWNLAVALESIVTHSFNWIGKAFVSPAPGSALASRNGTTANEIMNTVDHIPTTGRGATHEAIEITDFSMAVANNARPLNIIGTLGPIDVGLGKVDVTGTLQMYFEDNSIMDLYTGNTPDELLVVFQDTLGNGYLVFLPQLKYSSGAANATGQDTDVIGDFAFTAYRDATYGYTIRIARFAA